MTMTSPSTAVEPMREPVQRFSFSAVDEVTPPNSHSVRSPYVEENWLAYIGPTALLLARRIDSALTTDHKGAVEVSKWADSMGVYPEELLMAVSRLIRFGLATWNERDKTFLLVRQWPAIPQCIQTSLHRKALLSITDAPGPW